MGNRAVIRVEGAGDSGIYVHWNGGPESIVAFCQAAKALGVRSPASDPSYAMARLAQIIGNFFGGTLSVGVAALRELDTDNGDNGVYTISGDWDIFHQLKPRGKRRPLPTYDQSKADSIAYQVVEINRPIFERGSN